jgi:hypothetical protein
MNHGPYTLRGRMLESPAVPAETPDATFALHLTKARRAQELGKACYQITSSRPREEIRRRVSESNRYRDLNTESEEKRGNSGEVTQQGRTQ